MPVEQGEKNIRCLMLFPEHLAILCLLFFMLYFSAETIALGAAAANGCAKPPDVKPIDCGKEVDPKIMTKCTAECQPKFSKYQSGAKQKGDAAATACNGLTCDGTKAGESYDPIQKLSMSGAGATNAAAQKCFADKVGQNADVQQSGKECQDAMKACQGLERNKDAVEQNQKACKKAEKDAKDTKDDQQKKADKSEGDQKKNDDNAKKEDGGSPPQMPQMPQMPQQQQDQPQQQPQQQAEYPTNTDTKTGDTAKTDNPGIESVNLGDAKKDTGTTEFKGTNPITKPTVTADGFRPGGSSSPSSGPTNDKKDNKLDGASIPAGLGASVGSSGGSGAGGGSSSGNGTGASKEGDIAKTGDANPFEMPPGGGKLSVPKGKGSGDADGPVDVRAAEAFDKDFKKPAEDAKRDIASTPADDAEAGYTIFKMVKYRYEELKKKGSI